MNLTETLREPEGKTHEFKRDLSSPERFLRTVVAIARLGKLVARGLVREIGTGPRDPRRRYIKASD